MSDLTCFICECDSPENNMQILINENGDERPCCRDCSDNLDVCDFCGYPTTSITDCPNGYSVCPTCLNERFISCENCGDLTPRDEIYGADFNVEFCEDCFSREFFTCDECGEVYSRIESNDANWGQELCNACFANAQEDFHDCIYHYNYKPLPQFFKATGDPAANNLYFGIELEIETPAIHTCAEIALKPTYFYLKHDGSIDHGFEIVSHPHTLRAWEEKREYLSNLFNDLSHEGADASTQGLHVHVSRHGMSELHCAKLNIFVNSYKEFTEFVARREACGYAPVNPPKKGELLGYLNCQESRYTALNWLNDATAEFRIFRGTLNISEFFASIQYCHAAYTFTKNSNYCNTLQLIQGEGVKRFLTFLLDNRERYSDLTDMVISNDVFYN